jgi:phosphohistidine phosphatase
MKYLSIIRHAKSSWKDTTLDDFDRPLNKRGKHDAPLMGKIIFKKLNSPDLFLSSPAKRARKTAIKISKEMLYPKKKIQFLVDIYHADLQELLAIIHGVENIYDKIFLCGHNPGITDLVNHLTGERIINVPTCGVAHIEFNTDQWSKIFPGSGKLIYFDFPKNHHNS